MSVGSAREILSVFSVLPLSHSLSLSLSLPLRSHFDQASCDDGVLFDHSSRWRCQVDGPGSAEEGDVLTLWRSPGQDRMGKQIVDVPIGRSSWPVLKRTEKQIVDAPALQFQCETVDMITEEQVVDVLAHSFQEDSVEVIMEKQIAEQSADIPVPLVKEESVEVVQFAAQVPVQNRVKEQIAGVLFAQLQHEEIIQVVPITSREPKLNRVRDQIVDVPVRQFSW